MTKERLSEIFESRDMSAVAPGLSMVVSDAKRAQSYSKGHFDTEDSPKVSPNTVYDIASITKLFTTALILRHHQDGLLSIYDPVANYLPNFEDSNLTITDLLAHRADFQLYLSEYRDKYPSQELLKEALLSVVPPSEASEGIHYANLGFIYLGEIIEQTGKSSLDTAMHALFDRTGLTNTYTGRDAELQVLNIPATESTENGLIKGYVHDETARLLGGLAGNAGIFSSANDLVKFGRAWLDGRITEDKKVLSAVRTNYDWSGTSPQGLGWWMRTRTRQGEVPSGDVLSHTGFTGSMLAINPAIGRVGAVVCNRTYFGRENKGDRELWEILAQQMETED